MARLDDLIKSDDIEGLLAFMRENNLVLKGSKIVAANAETQADHEQKAALFNDRQQARKILLNSLKY